MATGSPASRGDPPPPIQLHDPNVVDWDEFEEDEEDEEDEEGEEDEGGEEGEAKGEPAQPPTAAEAGLGAGSEGQPGAPGPNLGLVTGRPLSWEYDSDEDERVFAAQDILREYGTEVTDMVAAEKAVTPDPARWLPENVRNPPRERMEYKRLAKHVKRVLGHHWPDPVSIHKATSELAAQATKSLRRYKRLFGYPTWADILRSMPDVVRIEGAKGVGFSVFLINCPRKKRPKPVIDPENPPWWWRPPGHVYVPPGPKRASRGIKEYEAFRNVVRNLLAKEQTGMSVALFMASKGLSGQKAKKFRRRTGFTRLIDMLRSMPDLIDFIEEPKAEGGYIVRAHDPNTPIPAYLTQPPLKAPPGAPQLPRLRSPKVEIYNAIRACVVWNWENVYTAEKFPNGITLTHFCSGYGLNGRMAKSLRLRLGYGKAADLIRSMPDLVTVLENPANPTDFIVKRTDPATVPPDYDPIPPRFPSDPRVSRRNPLGAPELPKGDMNRRMMFASFRELFRWWANRYPDGINLVDFCRFVGINNKKAKMMHRRLGYVRMGDLVRALPDVIRVLPDPAARGGWMVYPASAADHPGQPRLPSAEVPTPLGEDSLLALPPVPLEAGEGAEEAGGDEGSLEQLAGLEVVAGAEERKYTSVPLRSLLTPGMGPQTTALVRDDAEDQPGQLLPTSNGRFMLLTPPPGRLQRFRMLVLDGIKRFAGQYPEGIPILYFTSQSGLGTKLAIKKRRDLGYKKLLDLLLDMPEYVSIVRDEELPGGYRVVPTPQILELLEREAEQLGSREEALHREDAERRRQWEATKRAEDAFWEAWEAAAPAAAGALPEAQAQAEAEATTAAFGSPAEEASHGFVTFTYDDDEEEEADDAKAAAPAAPEASAMAMGPGRARPAAPTAPAAEGEAEWPTPGWASRVEAQYTTEAGKALVDRWLSNGDPSEGGQRDAAQPAAAPAVPTPTATAAAEAPSGAEAGAPSRTPPSPGRSRLRAKARSQIEMPKRKRQWAQAEPQWWAAAQEEDGAGDPDWSQPADASVRRGWSTVPLWSGPKDAAPAARQPEAAAAAAATPPP
eukprot:EG_transcript_1586